MALGFRVTELGSSSHPRVIKLACVLTAIVASAIPATVNATTTTVSGVSCSAEFNGGANCLARASGSGASTPIGLSPGQIKAAYGWPTKLTVGAGETIAIVDARDNPAVESDLAMFDRQYGLPDCTTQNGCFTKVDSSGGTNYPPFSKGWEFEIEIDVQWAHAIAPGAKVLLVEAKTANLSDMLQAEDYAKQHAQYVSNSWAIGSQQELKSEVSLDSHFVQSGVSFFAGSGDVGLVTYYPSASPNVISVGGTQLNFNSDGTLQSETGWTAGGGGCSKYEVANPAQSSFAYYGQVACGGMRATPDVAADSSGGSPVSVYDSNPCGFPCGPWFGAYGTSVGTPLWAARSADAGILVNAATVYSSTITYRDITGGGNGAQCLAGYNLCAGRGTWVGNQP
jgi:subtilase family serine protease